MKRVTTMVGVVVLLLGCSVAQAGDAFQAGTATIDITPPSGYRMSGYFRERLNTGVKDPLLAKAIVFQQGDTKAILIFCDVVGVPEGVASKARKQISSELGLPVQNISIAATHSHTGPLYFGALRQEFHERVVAEHGRDIHEEFDYPSHLVEQLTVVARQADAKTMAVDIRAGYGHEHRLSFNRRFHMTNGPVRFNPGYQNPKIIEAAGPIDPEIGIVQFYSHESGKPAAGIFSFALHLDTLGGTEYSADYPAVLQRELGKQLGGHCLSLFGIGTCGDINHVDVRKKTRRKTEEIGMMLSASVLAGLENLKPVDQPTLAVESKVLDATVQQFDDEQVAKAKEAMKRVDDGRVSFLTRVHNYKIMALQLRDSKTIPVEVQAFRLSPKVAIVTLPGEVFVELGIRIKQDSPFETTLVIELANDAPGYIPTRKAFAEGSYETVNSRVQPGWGEKMADAAVEILNKLHADLP